MRSQALRADLLMLITAMIWGSAFVAQRLGMDNIGPFLYTGLRFALACVVLLPVLALLQRRQQHRPAPLNRNLLVGGVIMGLALSLGINLQQVGLLFTTVTNSGFITGLYVIVVPILGLLIGQRSSAGIWLGASLAVVGMFLLSVGEGFTVASGDWLQLAGAFVWGVHVLLVGFFASRHDPLRLAFIQFATCALISLLFFGGWLSPIPGIPDGALWMFLKMVFWFWMFAMVKAIVPRYRYDQLMRIGWKVFLPLSLGWVVLVAFLARFEVFGSFWARWAGV